MKKCVLLVLLLLVNHCFAGIIDGNVITKLNSIKASKQKSGSSISLNPLQHKLALIVFAASEKQMTSIETQLKKHAVIKYQRLNFMPAFLLLMPPEHSLLHKISQFSGVARLSLKTAGEEESLITAQSILLEPSDDYPNLSNWYAHGYLGENQTVGLLDSGVASEHLGLAGKSIYIRKEPGSHYDHYLNGVRTAHGTGIACIYAGVGASSFEQDKGIAAKAETIEIGLAGDLDSEGSDEIGTFLTFNSLDWLLNRAPKKPDIINYSFGNGPSACADCPDWSGMAKIVDYVINQQHILWVKSAGNQGWVKPLKQAPYNSTLTTPADNFNGITVANMNYALESSSNNRSQRSFHQITNSSSRGPTKLGRKKPDIAAPGNKTRTCAPDPSVYDYIHYSDAMNYKAGFRLMGGTSSATPHVGASILLLKSAGITEPKAIKALLLNSADAWDDGSLPVSEPTKLEAAHHQVEGSLWDPTYGWGYLNMDKAFNERNNLINSELSIIEGQKSFEVYLPVGGKVTLVHERRVGHDKDGHEWSLTPLVLKIYDKGSHEIIDFDDSEIDSVHQVANCHVAKGESHCKNSDKARKVIVTVSLVKNKIDGANKELFSLAYSKAS